MSTRSRVPYCLLISVLLITAPTQAQQVKKIPMIGYVAASSLATTNVNGLRQGLRELGYVEGKTIAIEYRYAEGKLDRLPDLVAELVRLKVDVIVTAGGTSTRAAKDATATIPIVMTQGDDWFRIRRQSGSTRGERHRAERHVYRFKRQTAGASEGDRT